LLMGRRHKDKCSCEAARVRGRRLMRSMAWAVRVIWFLRGAGDCWRMPPLAGEHDGEAR
jgi:hypothetical protein